MSYRTDPQQAFEELRVSIDAVGLAIGRELAGPMADLASEFQQTASLMAEYEANGWLDLRPWHVRAWDAVTSAPARAWGAIKAWWSDG